MEMLSISRHGESSAVILIRLSVGLAVFFPEGLQKLLYPEILGSGRFFGIGIPWPGFFGPFIGVVEIVCGFLIVVGLWTRFATAPLIATMIVAIASTKIPILLGHDWGIFHVSKLSRYGFWSMQHEARADVTMLLSLVFLFLVGSGGYSVDYWIRRRASPTSRPDLASVS